MDEQVTLHRLWDPPTYPSFQQGPALRSFQQIPIVPILVYRFAFIQSVSAYAEILTWTVVANLQPSSGWEVSRELDEAAFACSSELPLKQLHKFFHWKNQELTWRMPFC